MKLKTVSRIGSVLFAVIATCSLASAQLPFKGVIQMGPSAGGPASGVGIIFGDSTGNVTTNLGSAVTIEAWVGSVVEAVSGDFPAGLVGGAVTFTNGWTIGAPQNDLWRINSPLGNFSFDLFQANAFVFPDSDDFLRIE